MILSLTSGPYESSGAMICPISNSVLHGMASLRSAFAPDALAGDPHVTQSSRATRRIVADRSNSPLRPAVSFTLFPDAVFGMLLSV